MELWVNVYELNKTAPIVADVNKIGRMFSLGNAKMKTRRKERSLREE